MEKIDTQKLGKWHCIRKYQYKKISEAKSKQLNFGSIDTTHSSVH